MFFSHRRRIFLNAALTLVMLVAWRLLAAPNSPSELQQRLLAHAEAIVTVKFVLVIEMDGAADSEIEGEVSCLVIAADGLAVCSNSELGGFVPLVGRLMGRGGSLSARPTKLEVLLAEWGAGLPAKVLSRDSDRDLLWLQIELGEHLLPYLDLADTVELSLGETFFTVRRLGAFFGRQLLLSEGRVGAKVEQPRQLWVPAVPLNAGYGVPVFNAAGKLAGITVLQLPDAGSAGAGLMEAYPAFLTGSTKLQDMASGLLLSAAELGRATRLVRELQAAEEEEE